MTEPDRSADGLVVDPGVTVAEAATAVIGARLAAVRQRFERVRETPDAVENDVHGLRVSTRRATAALHVFRDVIPDRDLRKANRIMRRLRRAAAFARMADVHSAMVAQMLGTASGPRMAACGYALGLLAIESELGRARLHDAIRKVGIKRLSKVHGRVMNGVRQVASSETFGALAREVVEDSFSRLELGLSGDLHSIDQLHELRLVVKRMRYMLEVVEPCLEPESFAQTMKNARALQKRLGELNDLAELEARMGDYAQDLESSRQAEAHGPIVAGLRAVQEELDRACLERRDALMQWWAEHGGPMKLVSMQAALRPVSREETDRKSADADAGEAVRP